MDKTPGQEDAMRALAPLPPSHVCVPVDLLDALCSEEGAEQKDLNIARALLAAAKKDK